MHKMVCVCAHTHIIMSYHLTAVAINAWCFVEVRAWGLAFTRGAASFDMTGGGRETVTAGGRARVSAALERSQWMGSTAWSCKDMAIHTHTHTRKGTCMLACFKFCNLKMWQMPKKPYLECEITHTDRWEAWDIQGQHVSQSPEWSVSIFLLLLQHISLSDYSNNASSIAL